MNSEDSSDNKCLINEILVLCSILAVIVNYSESDLLTTALFCQTNTHMDNSKEYKCQQNSLQLDLSPLPLKNRIYQCFLKRQAKIYFGVHVFISD